MPRKIVNTNDECKTFKLQDDINDQINITTENEPLLIHFKFFTKDVPTLITESFGNKSPKPYDINNSKLHSNTFDNPIEEDSMEIGLKKESIIEELVVPIGENVNDQNMNSDKYVLKKSVYNIMYEFMDANRRDEWPMSTHIYCMWCCHSFEWTPCALPWKYLDGKFYVKGNFCSFNCASAHNFREKNNDIQMWERNSLLNLMYKKIYNKDFVKIKPAPPKEVLKIFGGFMSIDDYRKTFIMNKNEYKIIDPPMISLVPQIEENTIEERYTKTDSNENLRLKRNKPLTDNMNTLNKFFV